MEPRAKKRRDGERYVQRSASSFCMTEITEARDCERGRLKATCSAHVAPPISSARIKQAFASHSMSPLHPHGRGHNGMKTLLENRSPNVHMLKPRNLSVQPSTARSHSQTLRL